MIIFYDGNCPLCSTEMTKLKQADTANNIKLEDLNAPDFNERYSYVDKDKAMTHLQAQTNSGEMIYGLDVTYQAWKTVGKYTWLKIFRLPVIRFFADCGYLFFARYRHSLSRLLMPNTQCTNGQCRIKSKGAK
ncbi:DUF393 domain-containing protein [Pseudoalteromonas sp. MMG006]|uniref:thiol-disulfide oxidoreductase DCC family protein n=1 Tax=unclassified Pseudoalteromonas TaxID=194690 RepID=UPI001B3767A2|nr:MULTISPECIES: DUF393 domain-containing protein [unclassified Pseudoalteromonas]MBQ4799126.1 DUF393 domain-containing protein [Pseudoalteromonas sp. MMG006]MBQ4857687.1 DUF393 domain-containing protein [Pseudoalteromonas sp. MMG007]